MQCKTFIFILTAYHVAMALSEVTILSQMQTIYSKTPSINIKVKGFDVGSSHDISLEIGPQKGAFLIEGKDFIFQKINDGVVFKLLAERSWVILDGRIPPIALVLNSVKFKSSGDQELLPTPVIFAKVLETPSVLPNEQMIHQTVSSFLSIKGTGFIGAKRMDIYFNPPLNKDVAYEIVSTFPLQSNEVHLRLRSSYKWIETLGPLKVVGIDTGGGPLRTDNNRIGITVANVVSDTYDVSLLTVDDTASQLIYHDEHEIAIKGTSFNITSTTLRFSNGLLECGINYTSSERTETGMVLTLTPDSFWRTDMANLPGFLTVLAGNNGAGFVTVGVNSVGSNVATVFERPSISYNIQPISRSMTRTMRIRGVGFPVGTLGFLQLEFWPALYQDIDYTVRVINSTEAEITLLDKKVWSHRAGGLFVTRVNTKGDNAGWIRLPANGVQIAVVLDDPKSGVQIYPSNVKVYQSVVTKSIAISGSGFTTDLQLIFESGLQVNRSYTVKVESKHRMTLKLVNGHQWKEDGGGLIIKAIIVDGIEFPMALGKGVRVATILPMPSVLSSQILVDVTLTDVVTIRGHGFTNINDVEVEIRPSSSNSYKILSVKEDSIALQLLPGASWLPNINIIDARQKHIRLLIASIDTGAGKVIFPELINIGYIVKDRLVDKPFSVCSNTCLYAHDNVCDDPRGNPSYCALGTDCDDCGSAGEGNDRVADTNRVVQLTQLNFDVYLRSYPNLFVHFSAPWSEWCREVNPVFREFANRVQKEKIPLAVAVVNCEEDHVLCTQQGVMAYPTLTLYKSGKPMPKYTASRTVTSFINYSKEHLGTTTTNTHVSYVVDIEAKMCDYYLSSHDYVFIHFYTPGEAWSRHLEPKWEALAAEVNGRKIPVIIAKVDCAANIALCSRYNVKVASTLTLYRRNIPIKNFSSTERSVSAFIDALIQVLGRQDSKPVHFRVPRKNDDSGGFNIEYLVLLLMVFGLFLFGLFKWLKKKHKHFKKFQNQKIEAESMIDQNPTILSKTRRSPLVSRGYRTTGKPAVRPTSRLAGIAPHSARGALQQQNETPHLAKRISELQDCFQKGLISEDEFQRAKLNILDNF